MPGCYPGLCGRVAFMGRKPDGNGLSAAASFPGLTLPAVRAAA